MTVKSVLIDARNFDQIYPSLVEKISKAKIIGYDTETQDDDFAHEGIKEFRGNDSADAFDWRRIRMCGYSFYVDGDDTSYYVNLLHADVENRVRREDGIKLLNVINDSPAAKVAHNSPFEIVVDKVDLDVMLKNMICTLQMAVSAFGPDEYDHNDFLAARFGEMEGLFFEINEAFSDFVTNDKDEEGNQRMSPRQGEIISKILSKTSVSKESYNGFVSSLAYSYGLKKLVKKFFNYDMTTFKQVLGDKKHMGELTGEEVVAYGCDDAYWAVRLFYRLYEYMKQNCPEAIPTFFSQENPMTYVYAQVRLEGLRIDLSAVEKKTDESRSEFAQQLRDLKGILRQILPFPEHTNDRLMKYEGWYSGLGKDGKPAKSGKDYKHYRARFEKWVNLPDSADDKAQVAQISSAVGSAWLGKKALGDMNLTHYYQSRLMMYDLLDQPAIVYKGKIQSDGETRAELAERMRGQLKDDAVAAEEKPRIALGIKMLDKLTEMAGLEQRMKLYLTPYALLTDPETGKVYPEISSMLATRRMACSNPNGMQLAKRGESTYVRGFILPDESDEVLVSADWSQIELVLAGEFSGDPEFAKTYRQLPYGDLHTLSTVTCLQALTPELTEDMFKNLYHMRSEDIPEKVRYNVKGELLDPARAKKYWRTEVGKAANFEFIYSRNLFNVGQKLLWSHEQIWAATEGFRKRYSVLDQYLVDAIEKASWDGYIMLPDGHRRYKWDVTYDWTNLVGEMLRQYGLPGLDRFTPYFLRRIRSRAKNQIINSPIQGTCATLAKRSILKMNEEIKGCGFRARFKMPIHDELVYSVHRDEVVPFKQKLYEVMTNHPDIVKNLKIDSTTSVGLTFEPFHATKAPLGQIELCEAPEILGFKEGSRLSDDEVREAVNYLFKRRAAA